MRMITALRRLALLIPAAAVLAMAADADMETLRRSFENPPDDARIMMRWWWFGPGVTKAEIERELRAMKAGGMGGVEVQPVYPMALDDPQTGFLNIRYLSDEFLDVLRFTSEKARELGLRLDLTLGSGWPFGGPHIPVTQAAGMLRCDRVPVPPGASSVRMPYLENGEKLLAVFVARGDAKQFAPAGIRQIPIFKGGWQPLGADTGEPRVALFFISSRTGQMVKRAAVGAEGYVLDHYDRSAIENHLKNVGDRLMQAFGANPPYAVFSDSLEVFYSDWTPNLLEEFRKRRGYDLTPYLPALVGDIGAQTGAIRHDWGKTLYELADDNYLRPVTEWAHQHGTRFRSQTYGMPPVTLSSNALVDLPEGEGAQWRSFSASRTASSASHLYGRPVTSSETWTYLHSPVFRATPLDMKAQADLNFLEGINQLVGHGWPYSPPEAGEPGWRFYAAAVFDDHNPWWIVMPDVTKYLQRISFLLRQGKPVNDVAIYVATADNMAQYQAGRERIGGGSGGGMGSERGGAGIGRGIQLRLHRRRSHRPSGNPLPRVDPAECGAYAPRNSSENPGVRRGGRQGCGHPPPSLAGPGTGGGRERHAADSRAGARSLRSRRRARQVGEGRAVARQGTGRTLPAGRAILFRRGLPRRGAPEGCSGRGLFHREHGQHAGSHPSGVPGARPEGGMVGPVQRKAVGRKDRIGRKRGGGARLAALRIARAGVFGERARSRAGPRGHPRVNRACAAGSEFGLEDHVRKRAHSRDARTALLDRHRRHAVLFRAGDL